MYFFQEKELPFPLFLKMISILLSIKDILCEILSFCSSILLSLLITSFIFLTNSKNESTLLTNYVSITLNNKANSYLNHFDLHHEIEDWPWLCKQIMRISFCSSYWISFARSTAKIQVFLPIMAKIYFLYIKLDSNFCYFWWQ